MSHIFGFPQVWENVESWLVYTNKLFWIAQPYFSTDIIKQSYCQHLFLAFKTFNKKKLNCFIYIALAKDCCIIKLGEFKSDQKYYARKIRKSRKPRKIIVTVPMLFNNVPIVWWGPSTGCFIYSFVIQLISENTLCS